MQTAPAPPPAARTGGRPRDRFRGRIRAYLSLARPANVATALADVLAGAAAAGAVSGAVAATAGGAGWLLLATAALYAGGVVLNDVFDAALDAEERPERPIPSGRAGRAAAAWVGAGLLVLGVLAAAVASVPSALVAAAIAGLAVLYDWRAKHHALAGPAAMGGCRGLNLLLGVSAVPAALAGLWPLALVPLAYVAAITAVSQGEVHGGRTRTGWLALGLLGAVLLALLGLAWRGNVWALPFVVLFAWRVVPPFAAAATEPTPARAGAAVRAGVLSLVVLDASLAACFAGPLYGALVLLLWPVSLGLARAFAVT